MLRLALCGAVAATALLAAPVGYSSAEAKVYNLRYADIGSPRGPRAAALKWWAAELETRSGGDIKVKFFWSQSLVKGKATMKAVGSGLSSMGSILGVYTPAKLAVWNFSNTPFLVSDAWVGMRTSLAEHVIMLETKLDFNSDNLTEDRVCPRPLESFHSGHHLGSQGLQAL